MTVIKFNLLDKLASIQNQSYVATELENTSEK